MHNPPTQTAFTERFGADQAAAIIAAAEQHRPNDDNRGSDPFKWALVIAIGHECITHDRYRDQHGITAPTDDLKFWIRDHADLASHDGDMDWLAALAGAYDEYLPERSA